MNINVLIGFVIAISLCSILLHRWAVKKFEGHIKKEFPSEYLDDKSSLNYPLLIRDISEKKISNKKIIKFIRIKDISYRLMIIMVFMCVFTFGLKFFRAF